MITEAGSGIGDARNPLAMPFKNPRPIIHPFSLIFTASVNVQPGVLGSIFVLMSIASPFRHNVACEFEMAPPTNRKYG